MKEEYMCGRRQTFIKLTELVCRDESCVLGVKGLTLTAWIHGKAALGGLAGRPDPCSVGGCNPELVLGPLDEPEHGVLQALHCWFGDWSSVDTTPVHSAALPLLQPVSLDGGAAIVQRRIPGQGHGGGCIGDDFGVTWRSGEAKRIPELDFL